jgi:cell division transport system permease protein
MLKPTGQSTSKIARNRSQEDRGAVSRRTVFSDRLKGYWAHHKHSAKDSWGRLLAEPLHSLVTGLVIAVALALPALLFVCVDNLQVLGERWDGSPQVSVFVNPRAKPIVIEKLQAQLEALPATKSVEYVSPEAALEEFEVQSQLGNALRSLESNPLPPALILTLSRDVEAEALSGLQQTLDGMSAVDDVVFDQAWVQRLQEMLRLGETLSIGLGLLLALGVVLVIGNTIRLAIESRREEIVVIKLVGGTNAFVRRPFLYTGVWYGLGGGVLALGLLFIGLQFMSGPADSLAELYGSNFTLQGLGFGGGLVLLLIAAVVGWLGSWLAVGRHLGDIEPS